MNQELLTPGNNIIAGQKTFFNPENKTLYFSIKEAFHKAGRLLNWEDPTSEGLGLNKGIIDSVMKYKVHLVVKVETEEKWYWIYFDRLENFIQKNNTEYILPSGMKLNVISLDVFSPLAMHTEI